MEIFETDKQFILLEEGMTQPEKSNTYRVKFSNDMNSHFKEHFPQFELTIKTGGGWGWSSYFKLCYKGFNFRPKYSEERNDFVLNLLNSLKQGGYESKMAKLIKDSIEETTYEVIEDVLKAPSIKVSYLEEKIEIIEKQLEELKTRESELLKRLEKIRIITNE